MSHKTKICLLTNFIHFYCIDFIYVDQEQEFCLLPLIVFIELYWILYILELCWKIVLREYRKLHTNISKVLLWICAQYEKKMPAFIKKYSLIIFFNYFKLFLNLRCFFADFRPKSPWKLDIQTNERRRIFSDSETERISKTVAGTPLT